MTSTTQTRTTTVTAGLLSQAEFDSLDVDDQPRVEQSTQDLLTRYGQAWLTKERKRLRDELQFCYGFTT